MLNKTKVTLSRTGTGVDEWTWTNSSTKGKGCVQFQKNKFSSITVHFGLLIMKLKNRCLLTANTYIRGIQCLQNPTQIMQKRLLLLLAATTSKIHYDVEKCHDFMQTSFPWKEQVVVLSHGKELCSQDLLNQTGQHCFYDDSAMSKRNLRNVVVLL